MKNLVIFVILVSVTYGASPYPTFTLVTEGTSMLPLIPAKKNMAIADKMPYQEIKKGDILITRNWEYGRGFTAHMAMYKNWRGYWVMKGLNNGRYDRVPTTPRNYCGRLVKVGNKVVGREIKS